MRFQSIGKRRGQRWKQTARKLSRLMCRIGLHDWRKVSQTVNTENRPVDVMRCEACGKVESWLHDNDRNYLPYHPFG